MCADIHVKWMKAANNSDCGSCAGAVFVWYFCAILQRNRLNVCKHTVMFALYLCWIAHHLKAGRSIWHSDEKLHTSSQTKHKGVGGLTTRQGCCKSCSLPGEVKGIFCVAKLLQTLLLWSGTMSELRLWSSRFLMCDWKCMCVWCWRLCFALTPRKHLSVFYESNIAVFVHANLLRSWKCPDPNRLWLHSGSPGMWPAPSPAPPLCWQTTSLQRETQLEERYTEKDSVNISPANNRQGPNDSSKNHSHLVIYSKQWELHITVGHFSSLEQCTLTEPAFADSACLYLICWTCLYHLDREMWGRRVSPTVTSLIIIEPDSEREERHWGDQSVGAGGKMWITTSLKNTCCDSWRFISPDPWVFLRRCFTFHYYWLWSVFTAAILARCPKAKCLQLDRVKVSAYSITLWTLQPC